jgi:hypothetical protein
MINEPCRMMSSRVALLCLATALAGCSRFASELDGVTTRELEPGPVEEKDMDWSCVSNEAGNPIMQNDGPPLDYTIQALDYTSGATPTHLRVRACYRADFTCARPATGFLPSDADGRVTLPLTEGFSGYLEIVSDDMVSTLFVFPGSLSQDLADVLQAAPVALLPLVALRAFGDAADLVLDPGAGVLSVNTYDCTGASAPGVRLQLERDATAVPFTFVDGLPIAHVDTTTEEGSAGFANVSPGVAVVKGYRGGAATEQMVGLESVLVRAAWVTVTALMPQFAAD